MQTNSNRLTPHDPQKAPPIFPARFTLAHLEAEIEALDNELETNTDNEALWTARDASEMRLDALRQSHQCWDSAEMAHAGAVVTIDRNGVPIITRGLIKRADLRAMRKLRASEATGGGETDADAQPSDAMRERTPALPKSLVERLTAARTHALRSELAGNPHIALAPTVHALTRRSAARRDVPGLAIAISPVGCDDEDRFEQARTEASAAYVDADLLRLAREPAEKLVELLALFVWTRRHA